MQVDNRASSTYLGKRLHPGTHAWTCGESNLPRSYSVAICVWYRPGADNSVRCRPPPPLAAHTVSGRQTCNSGATYTEAFNLEDETCTLRDRLWPSRQGGAELLRDGPGPATRRAYRRSVATFKTFCASHKLRPMPASERTILRFLASLSIERTSHGLATAHLSRLRHWHAAKGYRWPGRTERIRLALRAISKTARPHSRPKRQPMTVPTLLRLQRRLDRSRLPRQDRLAAWAAVTLGFFGALRGSEYLAPSASSFNSRRSCLRRHVTIRPDMLELRIPASKTDQVFQGAVVTLPRLDGPACPVRAMKRYLASTTHLPRSSAPLRPSLRGARDHGVAERAPSASPGRRTAHDT